MLALLDKLIIAQQQHSIPHKFTHRDEERFIPHALEQRAPHSEVSGELHGNPRINRR